jgi:hypothetical protein
MQFDTEAIDLSSVSFACNEGYAVKYLQRDTSVSKRPRIGG